MRLNARGKKAGGLLGISTYIHEQESLLAWLLPCLPAVLAITTIISILHEIPIGTNKHSAALMAQVGATCVDQLVGL
jgi:hypothetical protein